MKGRWVHNVKKPWPITALLLLSSFGSGCGKAGPPQYKVVGSVTHRGLPVPAGRIAFEPDPARSDDRTMGIARIRDGHYETLPGKGAGGGPRIVRIYGFDGVPIPVEGMPNGTPVFPVYATTVDLPAEDSRHDFVIPAEHGR